MLVKTVFIVLSTSCGKENIEYPLTTTEKQG